MRTIVVTSARELLTIPHMSATHRTAQRLRELAGTLLSRVVPNVPLSRALDADEDTLTTRHGSMVAYHDRSAAGAERRPVVLLHSVNACASSYEMRPLFEHYRATRPTYALDLPGFGLSERDDRPYTIDRYVDAVREVLTWVKERDGVADVIALSLSGEFAAHVAVRHEGLLQSLALLSPTGFDAQPRDRTSLRRPLQALRRDPVASRLVFDAVASRPSVSFFLGKTFVGEPDKELVAYAYTTSHRPDAQYAPIDFLSGGLFTPDVRDDVYARVPVPTLVIYDTDPFVGFGALPSFVARHARWKAERIVPTRGMPQFEQLPAVTRALESFWQPGNESNRLG